MAKYTDLDLDFGLNAFTGDVDKKLDIEAIRRSIRNLVQTRKYERFFHPEIDSGVAGTLFEQMTPGTKLRIRTLIADTIANFEPRAKVNKVNVVESTDGHGLDVTLEYFVLNRIEPYRISFTLDAGR